MCEDRIVDLEIRLSFLERHVEEMDKVMLHMQKRMDAMDRELKSMREQQLGEANRMEDEVPPHY